MEEAARLKELVEEEDSSHPDWDRIACRLGTGRLAWQCCSHYQATFNRRLQKSGPIVGEEAEEIVRIIEAYQCAVTGRIDWRNVAALVEGRTLNQVQYFHRKRLCPTVVRPWLRLEDKVLLAGVKLFGDGSWSRIAQYLPLRNNRQVRQRYKSQLEFAFSSGSGTGTGSITTGHCAQRKFGAWIPAEDELILKMSQSYTKVAKGKDGQKRRLIDFPLIREMYFPNRNVSQVRRRYHYLTKFISLAEHGKPSSSVPAGAGAEDEDDSCGLLMAELQKVTRNRQRDRKSAIVTGRLAATLPDGKEALGRFLLKGRQRLAKLLKREQFDVVIAEAEEDLKEEESTEEKEEESEDEEEDEEKEDVEDEAEDMGAMAARAGPPFPTTTYQLVIKKEEEEEEDEEQDWNDAQQTHLEYDQIFRTLHRLNGLRKAANGVMFTALDLNANELLKTALTEMIDPDVEENLQLSLLPANADLQADYSVASLDTMRYFLSTVAGCTLTRGEGPEKDSAAAHSTTTLALLPANSSTAFGWALLQVMTRALMCRLAEEPEEAVEEERREEVRASEEFAEARSIFRSLFTWPALLASPPLARDERITEELRRGRADQIAEGQEEEEGGEGNTEHHHSPEVPTAAECSQSLAVLPPKRPRGRPRKRTFYFDSAGIDFVRVRAHQAALFLTLHQSDLLGRLHQAAAPDGYFYLLRRQQGKHWPTEARELLRERVKRFLDAVWSTVDGRLAVKNAQKEKGKGKKRRIREAEEPEGQRKKTTSKQQKPNTTADEVQVVPMRRSTRWRIPKQGPQED